MSAELHALELPSMLDEKYRVESLLAVGGMGAVYRGRHTKLQKTVAIKILKRELLGSPELVGRFQREAVAASQIGHEGIIEVTDIGTSSAGDPFLVMEFLEGRDLSTCLKDLGPLRPATAVRVTCEILSALAAAHDKSIIHRDLKPENVFVCQRSRGECLKILDFGISRMPIEGDNSMRLTTTGVVMGTPYYMSPEQALGDSNIGKTTDLYSVGVILYELITGAVPYKATNYNALLHQILCGEYELPSRLADVSPELEQVIVKAMAIDPQHRYPDARSLALALSRFAETSPTALLALHTPHPDTYDDAGPVVASAPTSASSAEQIFASSDTQISMGAPDTLGPVVTPIPMDTRAVRSGKPKVGLVALLLLALAGGTTALITAKDTDKKAASESEDLPVPAAAQEASAEPVQPVSGTPELGIEKQLVTLSFAIAPHDAQLFVDGQQVKESSMEAVPGSFVIEVKREGFASQIRSVEVTGDQKLVFALQAIEAARPLPSSADTGETTKQASRKRNSKDKNKAGEASSAPAKVKRADGRFVEDSPYDAP